MAGVKYESYLNKCFKIAFTGGEGMGNSDVTGYVVPNFRHKVTE